MIKLNLELNAVKDLKLLANEENFKNLRVIVYLFIYLIYLFFDEKYLNLSKNKLIELGPIKITSLLQLNLNDNKIEKFEG